MSAASATAESTAGAAPATAATDRTRAVIPAALLYWGTLPAAFRRAGRQAQDFRFEACVPRSVEDLHLARADLRDGGVVVVGIEPDRLRQHLATSADLDAGGWSLIPDAAPPHLAARVDATVLARLNLLHGDFEPATRRRLRLAALAAAQVLIAVALAAIALGGERRRAQLVDHAAQVRAATAHGLAAALPPADGDGRPAATRLIEELRRREAAATGTLGAAADVPALLQAWWRAWPREVRVQAEVITATADRLIVRGRVPSLADATRLAQASDEVAAAGVRYRAEPMLAQAEPGGTGFVLTLVRQDGDAARSSGAP